MNMKKIITILFWSASIAVLLSCNAKPNQANGNDNEKSTVPREGEREEVITKPLFEKGQELTTPNGKTVRCLYASEYSADFATMEWIDEKDALEFVNNNGLEKIRVSFSYDTLTALPNIVVISDGKAAYNEDIPHTYAEAIKYEKEYVAKQEKMRQKEIEKQERLKKEDEEKAKAEEQEEYLKSDSRNFYDYLNTITIGTTMKDFNLAVYKFSDSANEYKMLFQHHGNKVQKLKESLIAKQKKFFPIIRQRYADYYKKAFNAMGDLVDSKVQQSGTTLTFISDDFVYSSQQDEMYNVVAEDMKNYRYKKLVLKLSNGRTVRQYNIRSKNDSDL